MLKVSSDTSNLITYYIEIIQFHQVNPPKKSVWPFDVLLKNDKSKCSVQAIIEGTQQRVKWLILNYQDQGELTQQYFVQLFNVHALIMMKFEQLLEIIIETWLIVFGVANGKSDSHSDQTSAGEY